LVADRVTVISRSVTCDTVYKWESSAGGTFTVAPVEEDVGIKRGT